MKLIEKILKKKGYEEIWASFWNKDNTDITICENGNIEIIVDDYIEKIYSNTLMYLFKKDSQKLKEKYIKDGKQLLPF